MSQPHGQVDVATEVGYCPSCGRTRNLRREAHRMGGLVRTVVTCETCHRTLSSSIGPATAEPVKAEPQPEPEPVSPPAPAPKATAKPAAKKAAPAEKLAAKKPAAKNPAARGGKPAPAATRKVTKRK